MSNQHPDVEMAVWADTKRMREKDGTFTRGMAYGLLFTALLAAIVYCAWVAW